MGSTVECERYERPASRKDAHPSLSNHETGLTSMLRAAFVQRCRFRQRGLKDRWQTYQRGREGC